MKTKIRLRQARQEDCRRLWLWRNEKEVRNVSFNTKKIPYTAHKEWFARKLASAETRILIGENKSGNPIGQIRLDLMKSGTSEVNILVKKSVRNQGFGKDFLHGACQYSFRRLKLKRILAHIRLDNPRSIALFQKVGFKKKKKVLACGHDALLMEMKRCKPS